MADSEPFTMISQLSRAVISSSRPIRFALPDFEVYEPGESVHSVYRPPADPGLAREFVPTDPIY